MNRFSKIALTLCYGLLFYSAFSVYPKWEQSRTEATISWDVSGYYFYLPALFIYKDIKQLPFKDSILEKYYPTPNFMQGFYDEASGSYVMKYASGQALLMSPFFAIAHQWAMHSSQYPANGFSFPYQICLGIGFFLYCLVGLFFLRKILLQYFKDSTVAVALLILVFGTNYLNYAAIDQCMTHSPLFTIYTLIIFFSIQFYKKEKKTIAILLGLLCGLATLIRPTEIISIIIPLLWGVNDWTGFRERLFWWKKRFKTLILAAVTAFAVLSIQFIYWKYASGNWVVYSYEEQGFSWLSPHVYDYSFSYRCGWLRFCPMMILAFVGLFPFVLKFKNRWPILLVFILSFYITTAWDVWDYGGTAGRAMVQYYPILIFPIAALVEWVHQKRILKIIFYLVVLLFAYLNIWWHIHAHVGCVSVMGGTKAYYWKTVGRWKCQTSDLALLDNSYLFDGTPKHPNLLYFNDFETDPSALFIQSENNKVLQLNDSVQLSNVFTIPQPETQYKWIRATALFTSQRKEWDTWKQATFHLRFYKNKTLMQDNFIRVFRQLDDFHSKVISVDAKPPTDWNTLEIVFNNEGSAMPLNIDSLSIVGFNE